MLDKQQLISTISTSSLRSGFALLENNLAPRLESKTENPKVTCCHTISDLCHVFDWALGRVPFFFPAFPPPSYFHFTPFSLLIGILPFAPISLYFPPWLFCPLFRYLSSPGERKCSSHSYKTPQTERCIWEGVRNRNSTSVFFFNASRVKGHQPTISQPINSSDRNLNDCQPHCGHAARY